MLVQAFDSGTREAKASGYVKASLSGLHGEFLGQSAYIVGIHSETLCQRSHCLCSPSTDYVRSLSERLLALHLATSLAQEPALD